MIVANVVLFPQFFSTISFVINVLVAEAFGSFLIYISVVFFSE